LWILGGGWDRLLLPFKFIEKEISSIFLSGFVEILERIGYIVTRLILIFG